MSTAQHAHGSSEVCHARPTDRPLLFLFLCAEDWHAFRRGVRSALLTLRPTELPLDGAEDLAHALLQLGCAAYCGRVVVERGGLLRPHQVPLDFERGSAGEFSLGKEIELSWAA